MSTETPRERHERGLSLSVDDLGDLAYLRSIEATMTQAQLEDFHDILFSPECRGSAGIRPAADMAVREMRRRSAQSIAGDMVKRSWRAW
jgi:hypothetical protein